jgi:site-specific DNA recombinase
MMIIPDPITGPLIREAFELFSTGEFSIWRLVQEIYKKGLTSRTGKMISISSMQQVLTNPFYYGLMRLNGKEKTGRHDPLISEELFDQCQFVLRKHRQFMVRQRKHNFFLRGFLFCPLHNKWLTAESHPINSKKRSQIIYYHCSQKGGCRGSYMDSVIIERFIINEFKKLQFAQEFIDLVKKNIEESFKDSRKVIQSEKQVLINKKKVFETQRGVLEDSLLDKTIDRETFKRKHTELQGKIKALEDQIAEAEAKHQLDVNLIDEVLAFTRNIHQVYLDAPEFLKRHYIRFFFERFEIKDKKVVKVVDNPIFSTLKKEQQVLIRHNWLRDLDSNQES